MRSVSESGAGELRNEEEVLEGETGEGDVASELSQVVLVGFADFLDDPVQTQPLEKA